MTEPEPRRLLALTLIQPWAWAIAHAGKRVENRTWKPPRSLIDGYIAIHAGKKLDSEAAEDLRDDGHDVPPLLERGAIVAVARVLGWARYDRFIRDADATAEDFGGVPRARADLAVRSAWFAGPIGWILDDVIAIDPVPILGAQGLWTVPTEPADVVRERWKEARRAA